MQRKWKQQLAVGLSSFLLCSPMTFAAPCWSPIMAFSAGTAFNSNAGNSKNFPANSEIFTFYNYAANHPTQKYALFGAFLGAEFLWLPTWSLQAGLAYYEPSPFIPKGIVTQGVDASSQNQYSYLYNIQSYQLLAEGKLLYNHNIYHPYLSAGVGPSFNNSENYVVDIEPPFTTVSNQFTNNTVIAFSYSLGFGVDVDITEQARLGLGYRFADFGRAQTGNAGISTIATSNQLSQSHLYANEVMAQFTFRLA